ncbi:MAG: NAD(P)/FAD-dependent oxidoreductase [Pseudomonadota bacterium]
MAKVGIAGAGAMGLAAAWHAATAGHQVTVYEADSVPGGMAAHFDFGGLSIERFYHFVCKADRPTFDLMAALGIGDRMRWVDTSMGYYIDGKHYPWGDPVSLLKFPLMSLWQKFRYGFAAFRQTKQKSFEHLENLNARDWIIRDFGQDNYDLMWKRLLELKFYEYTGNISAAWIATRIKRVGTSRKSMFQEQLGHIDGGSQTLVDALVRGIEDLGGEIRLGTPVREIVSEDGQVTGIRTDAGTDAFDAVISTVPTPLLSGMIPGLTDAEKAAYDAIENIGVVCLLFKLKKSVTPHFWLNVMDEGIEIPGIIQFSNLRPMDDHVVYVPYYMPVTNPKWALSNDALIAEAAGYLRVLNPDLGEDDIIEAQAGRLTHSQPVCPPGFARMIPPVRTSIAGLQVADTCFYYPEDRGISESARLAREMVGDIPASMGAA